MAARLPPGPRSSALAMRRDPLRFFEGAARQYGDAVHFRVGLLHLLMFSHPEAVQEVLVAKTKHFHKGRALKEAKRLLGEGLLTSEGEFHKRQRRILQPMFHQQRVASYADTMVRYAARAGERWRDGQTLEVNAEMMRLTLAIVGKTLFDADVEAEAREIGAALTASMEMFDRLASPTSRLTASLPTPRNRRLKAARATLDGVLYRLIAERRAKPGGHDLLAMLLEAQDPEGDGRGMSDAQVRDEAMTIFLAGHETTAQALTWTLWLLSQNPEPEARLREELDRVLGGRLPTVQDVPRLAYARQVLAESMRLYPPAWILGRMALDDVDVAGWRVPQGASVLVSQWVVHRDARWWPDPLRFDPTRFAPGWEEGRPRFAYFPFGGGPRLCIGEPFAWMEGVLLLAVLLQRWRFHAFEGFRPDLLPRITLRPANGMPMRLERTAPRAVARAS